MTQQKSFDSDAEFWRNLAESHSVGYRMNLPSDLFRMMNAMDDINGQKKPDRKPFDSLIPKRIQKNGPAMIVFWRDGTKTIVRRGDGDPDSDYAAFTAALGIKVFGSNSQLKKIVSMVETQKPKKQKEQKATECSDDDGVCPFDVEEQTEQKSEALDELQRVAEKFNMTAEEAFQKIKEAFQKIKEAQKD